MDDIPDINVELGDGQEDEAENKGADDLDPEGQGFELLEFVFKAKRYCRYGKHNIDHLSLEGPHWHTDDVLFKFTKGKPKRPLYVGILDIAKDTIITVDQEE